MTKNSRLPMAKRMALVRQMKSIHAACVKHGKRADGTVSYIDGANIAGFVKVAEAMLAQGVV